MPPTRRRRTAVEEEPEEEEEEVPQTQQRQRRPPSDDSEEEEEEQEDAGEEANAGGEDGDEVLVKKFVRYVLACEYQRIPIRRGAVLEKVFLKRRVQFKRIFELTQKQLRTKFGMAMVELPAREKVTLKEKRDAQKKKTGSKPPVSYILTTILPAEYRTPKIISPSIIGSSAEEAQYVALCTTIVSIILISPGRTVLNSKLESHLKRLNIDVNMPMDTTQNILKRMATHGYIVKVVDRTADDETIEWMVGARGMAEIGKRGAKRFVEEVYDGNAPEDLAKRLQRSLGLQNISVDTQPEDEPQDAENGEPGPSTQRRSERQRWLDE